ncbi:MAG: peptide deformylase [Gammaproteobacteria bacterium]|nr:peptide deformylase [Gammaproteobacteria bacterium]
MTVRPVIRMGHPNLRVPAQPYPPDQIESNDFATLIEDMRETLHAYGGIGLAAPQIDVGYRIAVIEIEETQTRYGEIEHTPFDVYINPRITPISDETAGYWEGCLSVPGMMGYVERPQHIRIDYTDRHSKTSSKEAHGFLATVFQHEFDHLDGILYVDRIEDKSRFAFEE